MPRIDQSLHVFRKTRTAIADTSIQKTSSNPIVIAHSTRHLFHITTRHFTEVRHLIDKSDLHGEKSIGRILDDFGTPNVGQHEWTTSTNNWSVNPFHNFPRLH